MKNTKKLYYFYFAAVFFGGVYVLSKWFILNNASGKEVHIDNANNVNTANILLNISSSFAGIEERLRNIEKSLEDIVQNGTRKSYGVRSPLDHVSADGCRYVFIDAGSNIGIQIRKLFEGRLFKCGRQPCYIHTFNERFGPRNKRNDPAWGVCAFAFEANPVHTVKLKALERAYRKQGWRVTVFTETAVGDRDGLAKIYRDKDEREGDPYYYPGTHPRSFSASIEKDWGRGYTEVVQVRLANFIMKHIASRSIPSPVSEQAPPPAVVLKLDVEGSEYRILPDMEITRALCKLDVAYIEYHNKTDKNSESSLHDRISKRLEDSPNCHHVQLINGDDESYGGAIDLPPLPEK